MAIMRKDEPTAERNITIGQVHTILGPEASFEGKLAFQGTVRIDGKFAGEVLTSDVLVVGEGAVVKAELDVGSIVINGEVNGNIRAKSAVEIHAPGKLRGNVETPKLVIDAGVVFEGHCKMENLGAGTKPPAGSTPPTPADKK
ncbi:MAG: polymer-forming cytoskeletal protein [Deltaproteobacteria bacterium]|nr:polymer-forming cytoskeletal protein [Deltaproteobacteria bacterium]